jgi:hypothetical protein
VAQTVALRLRREPASVGIRYTVRCRRIRNGMFASHTISSGWVTRRAQVLEMSAFLFNFCFASDNGHTLRFAQLALDVAP